MLWFALAVMTGLAVLAALWPLAFRRASDRESASEAAFYKAQLEEIERDVERGQLPQPEAASARAEAARRRQPIAADRSGEFVDPGQPVLREHAKPDRADQNRCEGEQYLVDDTQSELGRRACRGHQVTSSFLESSITTKVRRGRAKRLAMSGSRRRNPRGLMPGKAACARGFLGLLAWMLGEGRLIHA